MGLMQGAYNQQMNKNVVLFLTPALGPSDNSIVPNRRKQTQKPDGLDRQDSTTTYST